MLKIEQMQIKAELNDALFEKLTHDLGEEFDLLISGIRKKYVDFLKIDTSAEPDFYKEHLLPTGEGFSGGDMVYLDPDGLMYYKVYGEEDRIEAGMMGKARHEKFDRLLEIIKSVINEAAGEHDAGWEPVKDLAGPFKMLMESSVVVTPKEEEINAARELESAATRKILGVILKKDPVFMEQLKTHVEVENVDEVIKGFQNMGLVSSDFSLLCKKTGQQILKVADKSALEDLAQKGFKCFVCGASIADEKIERTISCSDFCKKILNEDYWFQVLVLDALRQIGFDYEDIFHPEEDVHRNSLFLNINNEAVMIYLSNQKLTLDEAYILNAQISAYGLKHLILVSSDGVPILMKKHLQEANPDCGINFIESMENLTTGIMEILVEKEKARLGAILGEMDELTPVEVEELIIRKILPEGEVVPESGMENVEKKVKKKKRVIKKRIKVKKKKKGAKKEEEPAGEEEGEDSSEDSEQKKEEPMESEVMNNINEGMEALKQLQEAGVSGGEKEE